VLRSPSANAWVAMNIETSNVNAEDRVAENFMGDSVGPLTLGDCQRGS
jgi:hypothetical protein